MESVWTLPVKLVMKEFSDVLVALRVRSLAPLKAARVQKGPYLSHIPYSKVKVVVL